MKHLIVFSHPSAQSLNGQFTQALAEFLLNKEHEVIIRDLYKLDFNPALSLDDLAGQRKGQVAEEVEKEQEYIRWADCITFIHPIWWTGLPAMMKGYIDRVFSYGFAYRYDQGIQKGLLSGKQAIIINTHGKSHQEYSDIEMDKALSLTSDKGIYIYCGLEVKNHFFFDKADQANSEMIKEWISKIQQAFAS